MENFISNKKSLKLEYPKIQQLLMKMTSPVTGQI